MKFKYISIIVLVMLSLSTFAEDKIIHNVLPQNGYIPNKNVAIKIALTIWGPIYGENKIKSEAPYNAKLEKGVWLVTGTLQKGWKGGVAIIEIDKKSGKILRVSHGK